MADGKFVKLKEREHKILHLKMNNPIHNLILRASLLESSLAERDLGVLGNSKVGISQWRALVTQGVRGMLGCIR